MSSLQDHDVLLQPIDYFFQNVLPGRSEPYTDKGQKKVELSSALQHLPKMLHAKFSADGFHFRPVHVEARAYVVMHASC